MAYIHSSAIVEEPSSIGSQTKIWHFSHILPHCIIGQNCVIGQNCCIGPNVQIGDGVKIQNNVSLYKGIICESDVFIGPSVVFTNVINPRSFINRKEEFKQTHLAQGCSIGANSTILCGVKIGKYAFIGAGSVVTKDVKPYALVLGNPARQVGWIDKGGQKMVFENNIAIDSYDGCKYVEKNQEILEFE
ncbi:hexapeptide transferase [Helicobacter enhydrae]|uniref:Hexapeptide transferase n=1 Tax=Helicobacter enhydrae TaxID=222136 RepID=A0A1B1U424_9HELI|nr:acyltransferase [Helicobacter enhydrae]ANV97506.1 hexapeptide transferase [Helicobacter enhydrae]